MYWLKVDLTFLGHAGNQLVVEKGENKVTLGLRHLQLVETTVAYLQEWAVSTVWASTRQLLDRRWKCLPGLVQWSPYQTIWQAGGSAEESTQNSLPWLFIYTRRPWRGQSSPHCTTVERNSAILPGSNEPFPQTEPPAAHEASDFSWSQEPEISWHYNGQVRGLQRTRIPYNTACPTGSKNHRHM